MKLLYKPFKLIAAAIAARIGKSIFRTLWSRVDSSEPPATTAPDASVSKVVGAAALEAATMASVAAVADRASASVFKWLTGVWPGKDPADKDKQSEKR